MPGETSTFLFADIAGFTALTEAHGDDHAADVVERFYADVHHELAGRAAEPLKTIGDAILIRAAASAVAVDLALDVVERAGGRHELPLVRIGMHTGSAVRRGGDWLGAAVNLAARVTAAAQGGEVLLTSDTLAAGAPPGVVLEDRGLRPFRHVARAVRIYRVTRLGRRPHTLPIDPVCHMALLPGRARSVAGVYVCSEACEQRYLADPQAYDALPGT